jgi:DUF971 family protein
MRPDQLKVSKDGSVLDVTWPDQSFTIPATALRARARDAVSIREQHDSGRISVRPDLAITAVQMVGAMGVNIAFSDGHDRAIYPWPYLRDIAEAENAIN